MYVCMYSDEDWEFIIGLVPSGVMLVLMQWGGRTHFLLAIVSQITEVL